MTRFEYFQRPIIVTVAPGYTASLRLAPPRPPLPIGNTIEPLRINVRAAPRAPVATAANDAIASRVDSISAVIAPVVSPELVALYQAPLRSVAQIPIAAVRRLDADTTTLVASRLSVTGAFGGAIVAPQPVELLPARQSLSAALYAPQIAAGLSTLNPPALKITSSVRAPVVALVPNRMARFYSLGLMSAGFAR